MHARSNRLLGPWLLTQNPSLLICILGASVTSHEVEHAAEEKSMTKMCAHAVHGRGQAWQVSTTMLSSAPGLLNPNTDVENVGIRWKCQNSFNYRDSMNWTETCLLLCEQSRAEPPGCAGVGASSVYPSAFWNGSNTIYDVTIDILPHLSFSLF